MKDLEHMRRLFAYFARWNNDLTEIEPLSEAILSPLSQTAVQIISILKENLRSITLMAIMRLYHSRLRLKRQTWQYRPHYIKMQNRLYFSRMLLARQRKRTL